MSQVGLIFMLNALNKISQPLIETSNLDHVAALASAVLLNTDSSNMAWNFSPNEENAAPSTSTISPWGVPDPASTPILNFGGKEVVKNISDQSMGNTAPPNMFSTVESGNKPGKSASAVGDNKSSRFMDNSHRSSQVHETVISKKVATSKEDSDNRFSIKGSREGDSQLFLSPSKPPGSLFEGFINESSEQGLSDILWASDGRDFRTNSAINSLPQIHSQAGHQEMESYLDKINNEGTPHSHKFENKVEQNFFAFSSGPERLSDQAFERTFQNEERIGDITSEAESNMGPFTKSQMTEDPLGIIYDENIHGPYGSWMHLRQPIDYVAPLKKPMNSFLLYSAERRMQLRETNPELKTTEQSTLLAREWADLSEKDKDKYRSEAKKLRADYNARRAELSLKLQQHLNQPSPFPPHHPYPFPHHHIHPTIPPPQHLPPQPSAQMSAQNSDFTTLSTLTIPEGDYITPPFPTPATTPLTQGLGPFSIDTGLHSHHHQQQQQQHQHHQARLSANPLLNMFEPDLTHPGNMFSPSRSMDPSSRETIGIMPQQFSEMQRIGENRHEQQTLDQKSHQVLPQDIIAASGTSEAGPFPGVPNYSLFGQFGFVDGQLRSASPRLPEYAGTPNPGSSGDFASHQQQQQQHSQNDNIGDIHGHGNGALEWERLNPGFLEFISGQNYGLGQSSNVPFDPMDHSGAFKDPEIPMSLDTLNNMYVHQHPMMMHNQLLHQPGQPPIRTNFGPQDLVRQPSEGSGFPPEFGRTSSASESATPKSAVIQDQSWVGGSKPIPSTPNAPARRSRKKARRNPNAPKHPMSAFLFYLTAERPALAEQLPDSSIGKQTQIIARRWNRMDDVEKAPWEAKAKSDKDRYARERREYQFMEQTRQRQQQEQQQQSQAQPQGPTK
ncbi:High mobility group [Mycoemilia scoparia]|uniref:High mobility group n=1 Tax=Mycoemilia scoparia TaxID=417184 RepID=A0A9W8A1S4_9FUNG|nr:High mobility group [Mycoemilia scoparia]